MRKWHMDLTEAAKLRSAKQFAYVISVLYNLLDACWWRNEAVEMRLCKLSTQASWSKLSTGLEKLNWRK